MDFTDAMRKCKYIVVDTETNGLRPYHDSHIVSLSFYFPEIEQTFYLPFRQGVHNYKIDYDNLYNGKWDKTRKKNLLYYLIEKANLKYDNLPLSYFDEIRKVWNLPHHIYIFHNAKFDIAFLEKENLPYPTRVYDTMVMASLVFEDFKSVKFRFKYNNKFYYEQGSRQLKWLAKFFGHPNALLGEEKLSEALDIFKNKLMSVKDDFVSKIPSLSTKIVIDKKSELWLLDTDNVSIYANLDVQLTWFLYEKFIVIIKKWDNEDLLERLMKHLKVAYEMEKTGMLLDVDKAKELVEEYKQELSTIENELKNIFGDINFQSPIQLKKALEAKGYVVKDTSKQLAKDYPDDDSIKLLLKYRKLQKALNTYLLKWLDSKDKNNVVHGSFDIMGTVAGRWSSAGDAGNFQNIPERTYRIKEAIVPPPEHLVWSIDYGQLEARVACWIAEDILEFDKNKTMLQLFNDGADIHSFTRDMINIRNILFETKTDEEIVAELNLTVKDNDNLAEHVNKYCRFVAKTMNFGLLYGGTANMLSKLLDISRDKAAILVTQWRELFPAYIRAQEYFKDLAQTPRVVGDSVHYYVRQPITKRARKFTFYPTRVQSDDGFYNQKEYMARKAWNNIVQGLSGFFAGESVVRYKEQYPQSTLKFFAQIHDALDGYCPKDSLHQLKDLGAIMVDYPVNPSLTVDISIGNNWQNMKGLK